jgi:chloramphenicol O-acetyltransferase
MFNTGVNEYFEYFLEEMSQKIKQKKAEFVLSLKMVKETPILFLYQKPWMKERVIYIMIWIN